jgi:hypothetical protein
MSRRLAYAAVWLGFALCAGAHAEMYKCVGPDGKTVFTSDRSLCPRASLHESTGRVQRATGGPEQPPARPRESARQRELRDLAGGAEAQAWRGKRASAEAELREARARLEALHQVAGWCNRGHEVWATDADGLRHGVDCTELAAQQKALRREEKRLEAYLAEGLEEECRRAGCLPGWIR